MQDHTHPPQINLDPESLNGMSRNFWNSAILRAGIKLGVFELIENGPTDSVGLAIRLDASPRFLEALLNACVVLGLLEEENGQYGNSLAASSFLIKGKEQYIGDLILHITNHWDGWGRLDQLVLEGRTQFPFESGFVDVATYWNDYMMGQHNRATAGQGYHLVQNVNLAGRRRLLDMGGGAGSYSIALCAANRELHAVVVDQKEPLTLAKGLVAQQRLESQITLREGDFNVVDLGKDYDVPLISGVVLIKPGDECRRIFKMAYDALKPGGMVIVQDFMRMDDSPQRSFMDTLMDIYVLIPFDPGAGDRFGDEVAGWLQEEGFRNTKLVPLPTHLALVLADKPA